MKKVLSIDIGGTFVKWALIDKSYAVIVEDKFRSSSDYRELLTDLRAVISRFAQEIEAVSIAVPGGYDNKTEKIFAPNLTSLSGRELKKDLGLVFSKTILIENDANLAALGEYHIIERCLIDNMIFVTLGTGVGGGAIVNGRLMSSYATAFEIGHTAVKNGDRVCGCGRKGCLDEYCSSGGLAHIYREVTGDANKTISAVELGRLAAHGDENALKTFKKYASILGSSLTDISNIFVPDKIKLGGGLSELSKYYIDELIKNIDAEIFPLYKGRVKIEVAGLRNSAGVLGAAVRYFAKLA